MTADERSNELLTTEDPSSIHFTNNTDRPTFSLALPTDSQSLSDQQCYVRTHLVELFLASESDVSARRGRQNINLNQVGLRCVYCAKLKLCDRAKRSVAYPSTISRIYQSVMDMKRFLHFENCTAIPGTVLRLYKSLDTTTKAEENPQIYWDKSARELGLVDIEGCGIVLRDRGILALKAKAQQNAIPRCTHNMVHAAPTSRAKRCIRRIRSKLGPRSPRYQAFLNLLHEYTASNDILIARQMKECLRGHSCLEQEFAAFLPRELVESSESDDESMSDDKSEVEIDISEVHSNEEIEIEEEQDLNIYEDYEIVEISEDEAGLSLDGECASGYKDDVLNYSNKRKTADRTSKLNSAFVLHDERKANNLILTTTCIPQVQQTNVVKSWNVEAKQSPCGIYTSSHSIPVTNIEHYNPESDACAHNKRSKRYWSPEEDKLLLSFCENGKSWKEIAASMSERTVKQCRERIRLLKHPGFGSEKVWTSNDNKILLELHNQHGNKWTTIAASIPGKTPTDVKNRWWSQHRSRERAHKNKETTDVLELRNKNHKIEHYNPV